MTFHAFVDPGIIAGASGSLSGLICAIALRRHRVAAERTSAKAQSELQIMLREHAVACYAHVERQGRAVGEPGAQYIGEAAKEVVAGSTRAQATQLLRSGIPPAHAASALGIGQRETLLIASVLRTLSPQ